MYGHAKDSQLGGVLEMKSELADCSNKVDNFGVCFFLLI
jgi:hypothetical protein